MKKFNTIPSDEEIAKMLFQFNEKIQRKNNANNKKNKEVSTITRTNIPKRRRLLSTPSVSSTLQPLIMPLTCALALEKLRIESIPASDLVDEEEERIKLKIERKNKRTIRHRRSKRKKIVCAGCSESQKEIRVGQRTKAYDSQKLNYCEPCWQEKASADKKKKGIECAGCSKSKIEIRVTQRSKAYLGQNLKYCEKCWEIKARADKKKKEIECARCSESKTEIRVSKRTKAYIGQNLKYCAPCWAIKARADKKKN